MLFISYFGSFNLPTYKGNKTKENKLFGELILQQIPLKGASVPSRKRSITSAYSSDI